MDEFFISAFLFAEKKPPLIDESSVLRTSFVCSNVISALHNYGLDRSAYGSADREFIMEGLKQLEGIDEAIQFMYDGELKLIPETESLETVDKLISTKVKPEELKASIKQITNLLRYIVEGDTEFVAGKKSLKQAIKLFGELHTIALQNLRTFLEDGNYST